MSEEDDKKVTEDGVEESPDGAASKPTVRGRRLKLKTGVRGGLSSNFGYGTWSCLRTGDCDTSGGGGGGGGSTGDCALY